MNKEKVRDYIFFGIVSILCIAIIGITYAYFSLQVEGNGKDIVLDSGSLKLRYTDGEVIKLSTAYPGDTISKTVTVENTGTRNATYSLYWSDLINTIEKDELSLTMECKSYKNYGKSSQVESGTCTGIETTVPYSEESSSTAIKKNISIETGITQEYKITVTFENKDYDQSYNMKKSFTGKVDVKEYIAPTTTYCTFTGDLTQGAEFTKGNYTYRYKQEYGQLNGNTNSTLNNDGVRFMTGTVSFGWNDSDINGWGVHMSDEEATSVSEAPCTFINGEPVSSYAYMFFQNNVQSINVSKFDTSNVTTMENMFYSSITTEIKGLDNFNTSKVTNMNGMFEGMHYVNALDVSGFDTSNVISMSKMFQENSATEIKGIENFDTSKVTDMSHMFESAYASEIRGIEKLNTSNVTDMNYMFAWSGLTSINLSNFDTSKVTNMRGMFSGSEALTLDLSGFDTSKVTDMGGMFYYNKATEIKGVDKWNTKSVVSVFNMFAESKVELIDLSAFDFANITSYSNLFDNASATKGYAKDETNANLLNSSSAVSKPSTLTFTVKS